MPKSSFHLFSHPPRPKQIIHGLSIPLGKLGYQLPRTLSNAVSRDADEPAPFHLPAPLPHTELRHRHRQDHPRSGNVSPGQRTPQRPIFRIGGSVIRAGKNSGASSPVGGNEGRGKGEGGVKEGVKEEGREREQLGEERAGGDIRLRELDPNRPPERGGLVDGGQGSGGGK